MRAIVITVLVMGFLGTAVVGFLGWKHFTRTEVRGVQLEMQKEIPKDMQAKMLMAYDEILDDPEILSPVVEKHGLVAYYKAKDTASAVEMLKKDSFMKFKGTNAIQILFKGPRNQRKLRDRVSRDLGAGFIEALQSKAGVE